MTEAQIAFLEQLWQHLDNHSDHSHERGPNAALSLLYDLERLFPISGGRYEGGKEGQNPEMK